MENELVLSCGMLLCTVVPERLSDDGLVRRFQKTIRHRMKYELIKRNQPMRRLRSTIGSTMSGREKVAASRSEHEHRSYRGGNSQSSLWERVGELLAKPHIMWSGLIASSSSSYQKLNVATETFNR